MGMFDEVIKEKQNKAQQEERLAKFKEEQRNREKELLDEFKGPLVPYIKAALKELPTAMRAVREPMLLEYYKKGLRGYRVSSSKVGVWALSAELGATPTVVVYIAQNGDLYDMRYAPGHTHLHLFKLSKEEGIDYIARAMKKISEYGTERQVEHYGGRVSMCPASQDTVKVYEALRQKDYENAVKHFFLFSMHRHR